MKRVESALCYSNVRPTRAECKKMKRENYFIEHTENKKMKKKINDWTKKMSVNTSEPSKRTK